MPKTKKETAKKGGNIWDSVPVKKVSVLEKKDEKEEKKKQAERDERRTVIESLINEKKIAERPDLSFKIEETEYVPKKWIIVLTPKGQIYQEPVPRYFDYQNFVGILASAPDKLIISSTMIDFDAMLHHTGFEVKGVDCEIVTAEFTGNRTENPYGEPFTIKNGTEKIGGNIIFAGPEQGFSKTQAKTVVSQIVKILNKHEEIIEWK